MHPPPCDSLRSSHSFHPWNRRLNDAGLAVLNVGTDGLDFFSSVICSNCKMNGIHIKKSNQGLYLPIHAFGIFTNIMTIAHLMLVYHNPN